MAFNPPALVLVPSTKLLVNPLTSLYTLPLTVTVVNGMLAVPVVDDSLPALSVA
jgi:hypothetical protein